MNNNNIDNTLFFIEKYINDKSSETLSFLKLFIEKFYYYLFLNNKDKINNYFYNYMKILKQIDEKGNPMPPEKQQALDIATS